jgi:hypothetical protein
MSPKLTKITKVAERQSPVKPKNEGEFEYYSMVEQSDIAPTLAGLLGFPVPRNNLGVFLEDFLGFWDKSECGLEFVSTGLTNGSFGSRSNSLSQCEADEEDCRSQVYEPEV